MCFYYLSCQPVQDVLNDMDINFNFFKIFLIPYSSGGSRRGA